MQINQATGPTISLQHLIVPAVGVIALLFNTALPYLGYAHASATCTFVLAALAVVFLVATRPLFSVSMLYFMMIGMTAFVAGIGIEAGGLMTETAVQGEANGAFSRLLLFYVIFVSCALYGFNRYLSIRSPNVAVALITVEQRSVILGFTLALAIIGCGVAAGLTQGFALLNGVNRYTLRNDVTGGDSVLFNMFLNNQTFLALVLGALSTSRNPVVKWFSIVLIVATTGLYILHGEQFMSVLHFGLSVLAPVIAVLLMRGKPVLRYMAVGGGVALVIGLASVFSAYQGQGLDVQNTMTDRSLLQGQVWYVVDYDAHLFTAPPQGGAPAFWRFAESLLSTTAPGFDDAIGFSGLRDVMVAYGEPKLVSDYIKDDVTFTMGQMAVPVFWFGLVGGALFIAFTGVIYGALCALQIVFALRGGVVMLWLIVKLLSYATSGLQQGDYWSFFSVRTLFYVALAFLWWVLIDSRASPAKLKRLVA
jgi:phosphate starvation-inducible membrane PsiE